MKDFDIRFLAQGAGAQVVHERHKVFKSIGTDTRKDLTGQLFIALKGEKFDAHQFIKQAIDKGAHGVMVHDLPKDRELEEWKSKVSILKVPDTLKALQKFANHVRHHFKTKIIGITGSNGKTTTKEFTAAILGSKFKVHYSKGSFNNHWGLPFSLLDLEADHQIGIMEMGMNHAGELAELCKIAEPDIVVCTTVGRAHLEHFGTQEKIAIAKEEIYRYSPPKSTRVYNIDDPLTSLMWQKGQQVFPNSPISIFSNENHQADVYFEFKSMTLHELVIAGTIQGQEGTARVPVFGKQNMVNLAAAAALSLAAGMDPVEIWKALPSCRTNWGRNQLVKLKAGAEMIFDGYNANPDSVRALLENIRNISVKGKKIGVFGEMLEMGSFAPKLHEEIGEMAAIIGLNSIYFVGPSAESFKKGLEKMNFKNKVVVEKDFKPEIAAALAKEITQGDLVIVKGSRGMKLERFVLPCEPLDFNLSKE